MTLNDINIFFTDGEANLHISGVESEYLEELFDPDAQFVYFNGMYINKNRILYIQIEDTWEDEPDDVGIEVTL